MLKLSLLRLSPLFLNSQSDISGNASFEKSSLTIKMISFPVSISLWQLEWLAANVVYIYFAIVGKTWIEILIGPLPKQCLSFNWVISVSHIQQSFDETKRQAWIVETIACIRAFFSNRISLQGVRVDANLRTVSTLPRVARSIRRERKAGLAPGVDGGSCVPQAHKRRLLLKYLWLLPLQTRFQALIFEKTLNKPKA